MITTDPNDTGLHETLPDGQNLNYLVLSDDERAKGFVRPVRDSYVHVGIKPTGPVRELTPEEKVRYADYGYAMFETAPEGSGIVGTFWTAARLKGGCGAVTKMSQAIAETYARDPKFYGSTFCQHCHSHFPVAEFKWDGTDEVVGS